MFCTNVHSHLWENRFKTCEEPQKIRLCSVALPCCASFFSRFSLSNWRSLWWICCVNSWTLTLTVSISCCRFLVEGQNRKCGKTWSQLKSACFWVCVCFSELSNSSGPTCCNMLLCQAACHSHIWLISNLCQIVILVCPFRPSDAMCSLMFDINVFSPSGWPLRRHKSPHSMCVISDQ